ncbi:hypothetical protein N7462_007880 [Penicillium macrosclerotiorum]|uniref:uncharacterized protein n=1 Tax=Penicillium macrosclerotiorum TaxID=303699 RepID=UPI002546DAAE|nr:uncharacterized protein N7462_007880 [Penicillium macrosclerotiorum]KAJ5679636.1 hypothetical protein N7462_007880 [Penicillium macrosclerotiorum]
MQVNFVPETVVPEGVGTLRSQLSRDILHAANATLLPPKAQIQAFADSYFQHLYHRAPIVDHEDLAVEEPSILLTQVICLIGSLLRHPGIQSTVEESEQYYNKVKALLYTNYERDPRLVLKALCLLGFRNITPPKVISLDCSWHWIGMAARLAYQIGLHRESTYSQLKNPGNARRIMWFLFVSFYLKIISHLG